MVGGQVIILHPYGQLDMELFSKTISHHQVSYLGTVPSQMINLTKFLNTTNRNYVLETLRCVSTGGEALFVGTVVDMQRYLKNNCRIYNYYGPTECTEAAVEHLITEDDLARSSIPLGQPMANVYIYVVNKYLQPTIPGMHMGEIIIGGAGVFAGYRSRNELTAQVMCQINNELCYKTGDLGCFNPKTRCLEYCGREDYQVKLRGQRIELSEIESVIMSIVAMCVVVKVAQCNSDYLVAYVEGKSYSVNEEQLRQHCQSHLPQYMIPSFFVILDKLPLNPNGKIDRKLLPPPDFSSRHLTNHDEILLPTNDIEVSIHRIWCEIFKQNQISTDTNIFTLGGHSLFIMQLFHRYKTEFLLETNTLSISSLFQHPTIIHHAQLIQQSINIISTLDDNPWSSLQIMKAKASFAQERIFLDEQIRFSSTNNNINNMYVIPLIYRISSLNDHISISRLQHAYQSIVKKHQVLRTALSLDTNGTILQHCLDTNAIINDKKLSRFLMINLPDEEHELNEIVKKILNQSDLFDLSKGHVINCHILRRDQSNHALTQNNDDVLTKDDLILFTIHHACFDGASTSIFLRDLSLAYQSDGSLPVDDNSLPYIDYAVHEQIMNMTSAQEFWLLQLKGYNLARQLSLPVDRQRSSTNQRSGLASTAQITFDDEICRSFLNYASSHHLTLFQLGLSIFYVFLCKLTHGETDLCISSINANRYRSELVNMIGMFVSTLPYRVELDPQWSFDEVVKYVQEK
ncbi:unnamed protein product, partial [Adineta steineri]